MAEAAVLSLAGSCHNQQPSPWPAFSSSLFTSWLKSCSRTQIFSAQTLLWFQAAPARLLPQLHVPSQPPGVQGQRKVSLKACHSLAALRAALIAPEAITARALSDGTLQQWVRAAGAHMWESARWPAWAYVTGSGGRAGATTAVPDLCYVLPQPSH